MPTNYSSYSEKNLGNILNTCSSNNVNEERIRCDLALERPYLTMLFTSKCDAIAVLEWLREQVALGGANAFVTVKDLIVFAERDPFVNGKFQYIKNEDIAGWRYEDLKRDGYFDQTDDAFITRISLNCYSLALPGICDLRETPEKNENKNSEPPKPKAEDVITLTLDERSKKALMKFFDTVYEEVFGEDS